MAGHGAWLAVLFLALEQRDHWSGAILAILIESHLGNSPVKFNGNWHNGVGGVI